jgi:hypothetical protein
MAQNPSEGKEKSKPALLRRAQTARTLENREDAAPKTANSIIVLAACLRGSEVQKFRSSEVESRKFER